MAIQTVPYALQNASHSAAVFRQSASMSWATAGVITPGELGVTAQGTPNMSVVLAAGRAKVAGSAVSPPAGFAFTTQGFYDILNDAPMTLTVTTANATNPRIDLAYVQVQDAFYSGATNIAIAGIVTGVPAVSPVAPPLPTNAIGLAMIAVAANATTIVAGNIAIIATVAQVVGAAIGTTSQRDAYWGIPVDTTAQKTLQDKGARWQNITFGWQEQYFALFNSTTNPAGATPAGWYPVGASITTSLRATTNQPIGTPTTALNFWSSAIARTARMWDTSSTSRIDLPVIGLWSVQARLTTGGGSNNLLRTAIHRNGIELPTSLSNVPGVAGLTDPFAYPATTLVTTTETDYVAVHVSSSNSSGVAIQASGAEFTATYLGPRRG